MDESNKDGLMILLLSIPKCSSLVKSILLAALGFRVVYYCTSSAIDSLDSFCSLDLFPELDTKLLLFN